MPRKKKVAKKKIVVQKSKAKKKIVVQKSKLAPCWHHDPVTHRRIFCPDLPKRQALGSSGPENKGTSKK